MISGILLGAGESKRMGQNKLILPWGGTTVFEHCLKTLLGSELGEVIVVLGTGSKALEKEMKKYPSFLRKKIKVVSNLDSQEGMSTSIRRGLQAVGPRSKGVLIALGDQPFLKTRTINALIHAFAHGEGKIVLPFRGKRAGNPALFDRSYVRELLNLRGDVGGRSIIERHLDKVIKVRIRSEGVLKDIDTWEEYRSSRLKPNKGKIKAETGERF